MSEEGRSAMRRLQAGDVQGAVALAQSALQIDSKDWAAWHVLGLVAHQQGRSEEAIQLLARATRINPDAPEIHLHAADILRRAKRLDQALLAAREALRREPHSARAHHNLGLVLKDRRQLSEAAHCFEQAIHNDPSSDHAYYSLGVVRHQVGDGTAALAALREAIRLQPDDARSWRALGLILAERGDIAQACEALQRAVAIRPDWADIQAQLGLLHEQLKQHGEAVAAYQRALKVRPESAPDSYRLGIAQHANDDPQAAIVALRRALQLNPDFAEARASLACVCAEVCDWSERKQLFAGLREDLQNRLAAGQPSPVTASASPTFPFTPAEHLAVARNTAQALKKQAAVAGRLPPPPPPFGAKRIRIGYLSSDFHNHPVGQLVGPLFQHHDRTRFQVCAYSCGKDDHSVYREVIEANVEQFVDVRRSSDFEIATQIQQDNIDILVDLIGYTAGSRAAVLAHRPAPVQISYLGFPASMGAEFVDYLITDSTAVPPEQAKYYTENLVYVPPSYLAASDHAISAATPTRSAQGLPESGVVFCGFNNNSKIEPEIFDVWMQILHSTPGSVLWLRSNWRPGIQNLRREARARGIEPERLVFAHKEREKADHLARQKLADLFLDTPLYNAHVTALDALAVGVPVVTRCGETFAGRGAASLLTGLGIPELIAADLNVYQELAVQLARNRQALSDVKQKLAHQRDVTDVFKPARFVLKLEAAYEAIRHKVLAGEPAGPISIDEATPVP